MTTIKQMKESDLKDLIIPMVLSFLYGSKTIKIDHTLLLADFLNFWYH